MCEERARLLVIYQAAVDRYLDAVRDLRAKTPVTSRSDYQVLLKDAQAIRQASEFARRALVRHLQSHGCAT